MPTRPRIDIARYHHIINRGVDQMNIFRHSEDKEIFLQIVNKTAMIHIEIANYLGLSKSAVSMIIKSGD